MEKAKGLTKQIAAMLLSGMLAVGPIPGIAMASEIPSDPDLTSEMAGELMEENTEEAISGENSVEEPAEEGMVVDDDMAEDPSEESVIEKQMPEFEEAEVEEQAPEQEPESEGAMISERSEDALESGNLQMKDEPDEGKFDGDILSDTSTVSETDDENDIMNQTEESSPELIYSDGEDQEDNLDSFDVVIGDEEKQSIPIVVSEEEEITREEVAMSVVESGTCGANLTWTLDDKGILTISGTGEMYDYESGPFSSYDINRVIIESGVTSIGNYAFQECGSLTRIELPYGITRIGDAAFNRCSNLSGIELPESVVRIGSKAFQFTGSLKNITIPGSVTSIEYSAFECCGLTSIVIPDNVTSIGDRAFCDCDSMESITIPESVTNIGNSVFANCSSLISIEIPDSVVSISNFAFSGCSSLTNIIIGNGVTSIGDSAFWECKSLKSIEIPGSVSNISTGAFAFCESLESITIPSSVTRIIESFTGCEKLTSITIPESVTFIGDTAFASCNHLIISCYPDTYAEEYAVNHNILFNYIIEQSLYGASIMVPDQIYTGKALVPKVTVTVNGMMLTKGIDYIVSFSNNINVGTATVTVTGINIYKGEITTSFIIKKREQSFTVSDMSLIYQNSGKISVSGNEGDLTYKSSNDAVAKVDISGKVTAVSVGTAMVTITAAETDNYDLTTEMITVTVVPATIKNENVSVASGSFIYNGMAQIPAVTVKSGTGTLKKDTDYTLTYTGNTNAGTAKVIVVGKGNFTGKVSKSFTINKAAQFITAKAKATSIAVGKTTTVSITGAKGEKSYKSSNTKIATVDKDTGKVTAKKVGTVKITATSAETSNYKAASKTVNIKIVPGATESLTAANRARGIKLAWKKVAGATGYIVYVNGKAVKTINSGNTVTYTRTWANTNGKKYVFKIVAKAATGKSTLSKSKTYYKIARPALSSASNSASKKMTVKWGKNAKATGYQIQYSTSKTFASGNKSVKITKNSIVSKTIGNLAKGKKYYVRVRTYKTVGDKTYNSAWSTAKSVTISK